MPRCNPLHARVPCRTPSNAHTLPNCPIVVACSYMWGATLFVEVPTVFQNVVVVYTRATNTHTGQAAR
eukprot:15477567-Alexandrium_andersonii.AAC.1